MKYNLYNMVELQFDEGVEEAIKISQKYEEIASYCRTQFLNVYENIKSIENVLIYVPKCFDECIAFSIQQGLELLADYNILSYNYERVIDEYYEVFDYSEIVSEAFEKYMKIKIDAYKFDVNESLRKASRGKWIGGGFGLKGAAKGALVAGMLNQGSDFIHGMSASYRKAMQDAKIQSRLNELCNDKAMRRDFANFTYRACNNTQFVIIDIVNRSGKRKIFDKTIGDREGRIVFENYMKYKESSDSNVKCLNKMVELINQNPLNIEYYKVIYKRWGMDKGLKEVMTDLGYGSEYIRWVLGDELAEYTQKKLYERIDSVAEIDKALNLYKGVDVYEKLQHLGMTNEIENALATLKEYRSILQREELARNIERYISRSQWEQAENVLNEYGNSNEVNGEWYYYKYQVKTHNFDLEQYQLWLNGVCKEFVEKALELGVCEEKRRKLQEFLIDCHKKSYEKDEQRKKYLKQEIPKLRRKIEMKEKEDEEEDKNMQIAKGVLGSILGGIIVLLFIFQSAASGIPVLAWIFRIAIVIMVLIAIYTFVAFSKLDEVKKEELWRDKERLERLECESKKIILPINRYSQYWFGDFVKKY